MHTHPCFSTLDTTRAPHWAIYSICLPSVWFSRGGQSALRIAPTMGGFVASTSISTVKPCQGISKRAETWLYCIGGARTPLQSTPQRPSFFVLRSSSPSHTLILHILYALPTLDLDEGCARTHRAGKAHPSSLFARAARCVHCIAIKIQYRVQRGSIALRCISYMEGCILEMGGIDRLSASPKRYIR